MTSVVDGLLAPHYLLSELHRLSGPVLDGDCHAAEELHTRVTELARRIPEAARIIEQAAEENDDACGCGHGRPLESSGSIEPSTQGTVSEAALAELAIAVAQVFACEPAVALRASVGSVLGLSLMATTFDRLLGVLEKTGPAGVAREMNRMGALLAGVPAAGPVRPLGASGGAMPGMPGLPGGGLPGGGLPGGGFPDDLRGFLRKHLKIKEKGPFRWNPEDWDHKPIGLFVPPFIDTARIRCQIWLFIALQARKEPPPTRPSRVVWSDNIVSVDAASPCAGSMVDVHGSGFGATQPPDVFLMVPIGGWCTPLEVAPANWTDKKIRFTLPNNVTSGPIGFADAAYVTAYNAWVDRMNKAAQEAVSASGCAGVSIGDLPILRHFSECPPETVFNRLRAGSAIIRSFTVNMASLAVAEPGDALQLGWDVVNSESIRIERTSTTGPLLSGSTSLVNPPAASTLALGPAAHTGPTRLVYVLTATGPCGTVNRSVEVVATKRPGLSVASLEFTQGIQTMPSPTVRFVAQKPTVVRATVRHALNGWGSDRVPNVKGRIHFQVLGSPWSPWYDAVNGSTPMAPTPAASITVPADPQRRNTDDTLNFLIPPAYCRGVVVAQIEVRVEGFDARADFPGFSENVRAGTGTPNAITFASRRTLDFRYVRVTWSGATASDAECVRTLRSAVPLLPTPTAVIQPLAGIGAIAGGASSDNRRDFLLEELRDQHDCSFWDPGSDLLGDACPDDDNEIWVLIPGVFHRGSSGLIPSDVCFTPPNDGPYAAHELSHCLDQIHLGVVCPTTNQTAGGGDPPAAWPNNGLLGDVPFDVSINAAMQGSGGNVWDVMTYCGTPTTGGRFTWPSPQRWQQLWDYIGP
ncbi:hypothetical protein [Streptomyces narbonensis]|uniref:hypothetical protein n=1 Tax=Streptomyces narbonensis TaxID=67333 RepID=UPI0033C81B40